MCVNRLFFKRLEKKKFFSQILGRAVPSLKDMEDLERAKSKLRETQAALIESTKTIALAKKFDYFAFSCEKKARKISLFSAIIYFAITFFILNPFYLVFSWLFD